MRLLFRAAIFFFISLVGSPAVAQKAGEAPSPPSISVVVFRLIPGTASTPPDIELVKFVDPLSGPLTRIDVNLPEGFTEAARAKVAAHEDSSSVPAKGSMALFLHATPKAPAWKPGTPMSITSLDGSYATVVTSPLDNGRPLQGASFDANLGAGAVFLSYFILPEPTAGGETREKLMEAELQRCLGNTRSEVVDRKTVSAGGGESILEIKAKSPRNPKLTIHCRLICAGKQLLTLTAVTPDAEDGTPNGDHRAMFDAFRFH